MPLSSRKRRSAGWPFWLLIAAWFCANTPQVAVYEAVSWFANARHFTHQQRLHTEVADFLAGRSAPLQLAGTKPAPSKPFLPVVPADAILKKIELAVQFTSELLPPAVRAVVRADEEPRVPDAFRAQPPHEPPRALVVTC